MKQLFLLFLCILSFNQTAFSQENIDSIMKDIRTKYYSMVNNLEYDSVYVEEYDSNEDAEPEEGDIEGEEIYKYQFYYRKKKLVYVEKYQKNISYPGGHIENEANEKAYYWNGSLFFIFKSTHSHGHYRGNAIDNLTEERIYIKTGSPIKYLTKYIANCKIVNCPKEINAIKNKETEIDNSLQWFVDRYSGLK